MKIPKAIQNLIESFEKLPGIGQKTAQRLTFYLLHVPQGELDKFALSVQNLKKETVLCSACFTIAETDPCSICSDLKRDRAVVCVVEQPLDVLALEKNGKFHGIYHVLHGKIDPLNNVGPDEIYIRQLLDRIMNNEARIMEIILATNPTMEGEATAMYIAKQLKISSSAKASADKQNLKDIEKIQKKLFTIGSILAGVSIDHKSLSTRELEKEIDLMEEKLPKLTGFILPGGSIISAQIMFARTLVRRAERKIVGLGERSKSDNKKFQEIIPYINRLSDYLFILGRYKNNLMGVREKKWKTEKGY